MNILNELKQRFDQALQPLIEDRQSVLDMIRPAEDARFGDYQANFAMPLGKTLGRPPREVAGRWWPAWTYTTLPARRKSPARVSSICGFATSG